MKLIRCQLAVRLERGIATRDVWVRYQVPPGFLFKGYPRFPHRKHRSCGRMLGLFLYFTARPPPFYGHSTLHSIIYLIIILLVMFFPRQIELFTLRCSIFYTVSTSYACRPFLYVYFLEESKLFVVQVSIHRTICVHH